MLNFDPATHTYTLNGDALPSVTTILQAGGLIDFTGINPDVLQRAADFGKCVHQATALDDMGDLDEQSLDPAIKPYLEAWRSFRGVDDPIKFDCIEQALFHPTYQFAGTPDRISGDVIIDIKTGSIVPPWTGLQLAAYAILADLPTARRIAVQLKADGTYQIHKYKDRKDRGTFLSCLNVYQWRQNHAS
jgi:hypothetical protein